MNNHTLLERSGLALWITVLACGVATADDNALIRGTSNAHDPSSIVEHDGRYYLFFTGRGISSRSSTDLRDWRTDSRVFERSETPQWIYEHVPGFRGHYWAPDLIELNGKYLLYYSASRFGKQTSAIGLAVNETLDPQDPNYAWRDAGMVVSSSEGAPYNAIDPSVLLDSDGRLWMVFGSYWNGIYLVELDAKTGGALQDAAEPVQLAYAESIEAATLVRRGEYYYLFVNHGTCCRGVESTYRILVGRSEDIQGPYIDREEGRLLEGGGTLVLDTEGRRIGPGHVAPIGDQLKQFAFHFYDGENRGRSNLATASWQWSDDDWPSATDVRLSDPKDVPPRWPQRTAEAVESDTTKEK
ncbi:arabinan endo-1,5-alpha-L-arabinosidase [Aeoliella sp.]|uniref:arabinan endo-1,5-alpha-L-arabinosidase n=1 Tax=Aeoliella sp. TaxID=2795800 RepID=UPI003CCBE8A2